MAEEVALRRGGQRLRRLRAVHVERHREEPRLAAEHHGAAARRIQREAVPARRHRYGETVAAIGAQHDRLVPLAAAARGQVQRVGLRSRPQGARRGAACQRQRQEGAAVNLHRGH